jgi:hypothetical protein
MISLAKDTETTCCCRWLRALLLQFLGTAQILDFRPRPFKVQSSYKTENNPSALCSFRTYKDSLDASSEAQSFFDDSEVIQYRRRKTYVKLLYPVHMDGRSGVRSEKSNMLNFSDPKSDRTPDRKSVSPVNTRCPVRRPGLLCVRLIAMNQTIDSMHPPGIKFLLIYMRTGISCKRNHGVDEEDKTLSLTNFLNCAGDVTAVVR